MSLPRSASSQLQFHPVFRDLDSTDLEVLNAVAEEWTAPSGAVILYPGDAGEEMVFLLSGSLEYQGRRFLAGEIWGLERLADAKPLDAELKTLEATHWLRWTPDSLRTAHAKRKALLRRLSRDPKNPLALLLNTHPRSRDPHSRRVLRKSLRPLLFWAFISGILAGMAALFWTADFPFPKEAFLALPALYIGWALAYLVSYFAQKTLLDSRSVVGRRMDWRRLAVESRRVPLEQIQGIDSSKRGILSHVLRMGTLCIQTSASGGDLEIPMVDNPEDLRKAVLARRDSTLALRTGREREQWRRDIEARQDNPLSPRCLREGQVVETGTKTFGEYRFRKSRIVLLGRLFLPLLILISLVVLTFLTTFEKHSTTLYLLAVLPLFWALYRLEDWRNDHFFVSGGYAVDLDRKPLGIKETRRQVQLASVQNIKTEQKGILAFLFRFGDVILVTAGGAADAVFEKVARPWKVQEALFRLRDEELARLAEAEAQRRRREFLDFADAMSQSAGFANR